MGSLIETEGLSMHMIMDDNEELDLVCLCTSLIMYYYWKYIHKQPCMKLIQYGNMWLIKILNGNESRCHLMFRMERDVLFRLGNNLETRYGLRGLRRMSAIEILRMLLYILGQGIRNRLAQVRFQHSGETLSRYFSVVLDNVYKMTIDIIKSDDLDFKEIFKNILQYARYMHHFKVICIFSIYIYQLYD